MPTTQTPTVTPIPDPVVTTVQATHRLSPAEFASVEHCVFVDINPRYRCTVHYAVADVPGYCAEEVVWWDQSDRSSYARPIAPPDDPPDPIPAARAALAALGIEVQA